MYMRLKDGKQKVLTLSYDDGTTQDIKLVEIMKKHGLKGTFNINSGLLLPEDANQESVYSRMTHKQAQNLYLDFENELAVHTVTHPFLDRIKDSEVLTEVLDDRNNIEKEFGNIIRGMAYPYGTYNEKLVKLLKKCGICYSRTIKSTESFAFPNEWLTLHPTCHHNNPRLMELAKRFAEEEIKQISENRMFYLWGHSYEFDVNKNWEVIEEFAEYIGGRDDIWYATNIEIYDYVTAYNNLHVSIDKKIVHNPSVIDVWFFEQGKVYCIRGGETLQID